MQNLKGRCIFAQSGGPTAVINSSIAGGILNALKQNNITGVLCANHGIKGVLDEDFFDMQKESKKELLALINTPSMAFGSVRYKLKDYTEDETDYKRILEVFEKYDVKYFFYIGGNDSMDTCKKISEYATEKKYPVNVIGIPKTVDNDLILTDHCPGYGSSAKYIATTLQEIKRDAIIYDNPLCIIMEIMGRNAGWLTASASLADTDLIYLPEVPFSLDKFKDDVKTVIDKKKYCVVAVSEGIKDKDGKYVNENDTLTDVFGHVGLGDVSRYLKSEIESMGIKCKAIEPNIIQRCASHLSSLTDVNEAFKIGKFAVMQACKGESGKMVVIKRKNTKNYKTILSLEKLEDVANNEKLIPKEWINEDGTGLTSEFKDYVLPLIKGDTKPRKENGLISYAKLKYEKFKL